MYLELTPNLLLADVEHRARVHAATSPHAAIEATADRCAARRSARRASRNRRRH